MSAHTPPTGPATGSAAGRGPTRALAWPIGIAVILAVSVAANVFMFRLANGDPSFAVEPDYYRKAVHWDDELAQRRHNVELGWRTTAALTPAGDGGAELRVWLTDSTGAPLDGATVRAQAFAVGRAADVSNLTLVASAHPAGGSYAARLPAARAGRWELRLEATRGADRFTAVERLETMQ